jgi:two-component system phosphate regulon response regulator PhoB
VVEDEEAIRSMLIIVLQQYNFKILEVASVVEAQLMWIHYLGHKN